MFKILSALEEGRDEALDILDAYLEDMDGYFEKGEYPEEAKDEQRKVTRRFSAMVSYLEKDGLLRKTIATQGSYLEITVRGKRKLENLKDSLENALPAPSYAQNSPLIKGSTIITFDIPEKERNKRDWLRNALKNMDFEMIHKSVWMSQKGIPKEFLKDIRELDLENKVEVLQMSKEGSFKKIKT